MTSKLNSQKTTHPKLQLVGLLMATALLATGCGGGGGGGDSPAAPPAGGPPAGSPPAPSDVANLANIEACPASENPITSKDWHTVCLVGKRLVGKDPITSQACELRFKANGVFEYAKNGVVIKTTPAFSTWRSTDGTYMNSFNVGAGFRFFSASLKGAVPIVSSSVFNEFDIYEFKVNIEDSKLAPNEPTFNEDTVEFFFTDGKTAVKTTENCKLNNI
jgi:hypothetical protein